VTGALERVIRRRTQRGDAEGCDLCGDPVLARHRHVLDERVGEPRCVCTACALLFTREAAGRGHYRLVPEERLRLPDLGPGDLGVPVGLAFFVPSADGSVVAHYPSPMGATRWEVDPEVWRVAQERCPALTDLQPGVQALLVNTTRGAREHWIVPIDDCYRLVSLIRGEWTGLSGGDRVWPAIDRFFARLDPTRRTADHEAEGG
jgi:Family of unknown function (DUF5947)